MAKRHLIGINGKTLCNAVIPVKNITDNLQSVNCLGCRKLANLPIAEIEQNNTKPDWSRRCIVCGETPIMPATEMCGPCTTGEAATFGGNW